jgi:hypothetical protein
MYAKLDWKIYEKGHLVNKGGKKKKTKKKKTKEVTCDNHLLIWKIKKVKDDTLKNHLQANSENKRCVCQMPFKPWTLLNIMVV